MSQPSCSKCSRPLQSQWNYCMNCGQKIHGVVRHDPGKVIQSAAMIIVPAIALLIYVLIPDKPPQPSPSPRPVTELHKQARETERLDSSIPTPSTVVPMDDQQNSQRPNLSLRGAGLFLVRPKIGVLVLRSARVNPGLPGQSEDRFEALYDFAEGFTPMRRDGTQLPSSITDVPMVGTIARHDHGIHIRLLVAPHKFDQIEPEKGVKRAEIAGHHGNFVYPIPNAGSEDERRYGAWWGNENWDLSLEMSEKAGQIKNIEGLILQAAEDEAKWADPIIAGKEIPDDQLLAFDSAIRKAVENGRTESGWKDD